MASKYTTGADILPNGIVSFYVKRNGVKFPTRFNVSLKNIRNPSARDNALLRTKAKAVRFAQALIARESGELKPRAHKHSHRKKKKFKLTL